jgi:hypothetical protein
MLTEDARLGLFFMDSMTHLQDVSPKDKPFADAFVH